MKIFNLQERNWEYNNWLNSKVIQKVHKSLKVKEKKLIFNSCKLLYLKCVKRINKSITALTFSQRNSLLKNGINQNKNLRKETESKIKKIQNKSNTRKLWNSLVSLFSTVTKKKSIIQGIYMVFHKVFKMTPATSSSEVICPVNDTMWL